VPCLVAQAGSIRASDVEDLFLNPETVTLARVGTEIVPVVFLIWAFVDVWKSLLCVQCVAMS
jgi:hypothetical protein